MVALIGGFLVLSMVYFAMGFAYKPISKSPDLFFFMYALTFFITSIRYVTTLHTLSLIE